MIRSPLFSELFSLRDSLDQFANQAFGGMQRSGQNGNRSTMAAPMPIDVFATNDQAVIIAAVPGMRPEDLDLSIHQDTITMSGSVGSVADTEEAKDATWYVSELASGTYRRSITLPFAVDADRANATFENGILRIEVPKAEAAKPRKISISASKPHQLETGGKDKEKKQAAD